MGDYFPTQKEYDAMAWCIERGIRISPRGIQGKREWYVELNLGKGWRRSPETYGPVEVWEVVFNYYKYYYDKRDETGKKHN